MRTTTIAARANLDLIEENYRRWQEARAVDSGWSAFFEGFELGNCRRRNGAAVADHDSAGRQVRCKRGSTVWFTRIALWVTRSRG